MSVFKNGYVLEEGKYEFSLGLFEDDEVMEPDEWRAHNGFRTLIISAVVDEANEAFFLNVYIDEYKLPRRYLIELTLSSTMVESIVTDLPGLIQFMKDIEPMKRMIEYAK